MFINKYIGNVFCVRSQLVPSGHIVPLGHFAEQMFIQVLLASS